MFDDNDVILNRVKELIKDKVDTKNIKNIISEEFELSQSQSASIIKRARKQLGLFKPNSGKVSDKYIDEDEDMSEVHYKRESSKYTYKTFGRYSE